ncbi:hypothetical protein TNCV_3609331 [Trichonephila clavipes]|nr:hypothetical protein TNCV_3609331 [Trichonephila clavipes]
MSTPFHFYPLRLTEDSRKRGRTAFEDDPRDGRTETATTLDTTEKCTSCLTIDEWSIAARIGRDPMTDGRIWNRWVQGGNMECRAGSQRPPITSRRENRHVTHMALQDRAAT